MTESTGSPSSHSEPPCFGQRVKCGDLSENERVAFLTQKFDVVLNKNKASLVSMLFVQMNLVNFFCAALRSYN